MTITICNKDTGRAMGAFATIGVDDKSARLLSEGHIVVKVDQPSPEHRWNQTNKTWVKDAELVAKKQETKKKFLLAMSDQDMARISEDVIFVLIAKGIFALDDLPQESQAKLIAREKLRQEI